MKKLFLYGPPASGKTTLGRELAKRLSVPFVDLDEVVGKKAGCTIAELFAKEDGEKGFRALEKEALTELCAPAGGVPEAEADKRGKTGEEPEKAAEAPLTVIALGGGTLLDGDCRAAAEGAGSVVCLRVSDDAIKARVAGQSGQRPLAQDAKALEKLLKERAEHYASFPLQYDVPEDSGKDWKEAYARMAADFDNFRKRTARDREELAKFAASDILKDLLGTADNLALALDKAADKEDPFVKGVKLAYDGYLKVLADHGAVPVDALGEPFDANFHEALAQMPSETVEEGKVMNEIKKGWLLNGKLLRAAQVVVSSGKANG